ncbi:boule [Ramazzottius varieornatus]|uniref:Boule n=1 Tax=Ramazzottius varieornatus TaxID=947166 RepID=A0A1D1VKH8_RAMVA|nr:boule [Ramazzottius varieornatus]
MPQSFSTFAPAISTPLSHVSEASREAESSFHSEPHSFRNIMDDAGSNNTSNRTFLHQNDGRVFHNSSAVDNKGPSIVSSSREDRQRIYVRSRIFIGGLTDAINEDDLRDLFARLCPGETVEILIKQRGSSQFRGYGFATFKNKAVADKALLQGEGEKCSVKGVKLNMCQAFRREDPLKLQQQGRVQSGGQGRAGILTSDTTCATQSTYPFAPYPIPMMPYAYPNYFPMGAPGLPYYSPQAYSLALASLQWSGATPTVTSPLGTVRTTSRTGSDNGSTSDFNLPAGLSGRTSAMSTGSSDSNTTQANYGIPSWNSSAFGDPNSAWAYQNILNTWNQAGGMANNDGMDRRLTTFGANVNPGRVH